MTKRTDKVIFTICSVNYLSQAITLGNSLKDTNPDIEFRIYLVDRLEGREELTEKVPFTLIEIEQIPIAEFEEMCLKYNVVELNTSVKPFIFDHILKTEPNVEQLVYFDPDIMVFQPLNELFGNLDNYNMVLTPHILTPSDDDSHVQPERNFLSTGIFNLGFIGIKRSPEIERFLQWWMKRLIDQGYNRLEHHLFFDQKWINYAPVFFDRVYIEKGRGYNMAAWNLHERRLSIKDGMYYVNEKEPLVFYHFSSYKVARPDLISAHTTYSFTMRPDLKDIISLYHDQLLNNGEHYFKQFPYFYTGYKQQVLRKKVLQHSSPFMKKLRLLKYRIEEKLNINIGQID